MLSAKYRACSPTTAKLHHSTPPSRRMLLQVVHQQKGRTPSAGAMYRGLVAPFERLYQPVRVLKQKDAIGKVDMFLRKSLKFGHHLYLIGDVTRSNLLPNSKPSRSNRVTAEYESDARTLGVFIDKF